MNRNDFWAQQFAQGLDGCNEVGSLSLLAHQCGNWADLALAEYDKRFTKGAAKGPAEVKAWPMGNLICPAGHANKYSGTAPVICNVCCLELQPPRPK